MTPGVGSKTRPVEVGDFIYCRSAYHRNQLGIPREAGLVMEVKRSNYRLLYGTDKFCWLPGDTLARVDGEVHFGTLAGRLHWIIKEFGALDCELVTIDLVHRATLRVDRIDDQMIDLLREMIGPDDFISLTLVPEGMAFMLAEVRFRDRQTTR
jgi:hypothetical protein